MKHKTLLSHVKMGKEIITFCDIENEKQKFYRHKSPMFLEDLDIENVLVSNKISSGKKAINTLLINLHDDYKTKPLHITLPKTSAYVKRYDGKTKCMYFLIEDDDLLKRYNAIWDKVSADIKKEFDGKPVYNKKCLKTKIKSYGDEAEVFTIKKCLRELRIILVQ